ncbi:DNA polymerase [Frankia sp. AgB32]|uniref:DNA polymerase n=1 Tax=Frankia sp. AgB32 TaxID=631119 RepID=UPI00200CF11B|nr:DNA polymerase [Frankia sp. AgB32]MCK9896002.1 DNA polymerase [Frankia sp. AgB32]
MTAATAGRQPATTGDPLAALWAAGPASREPLALVSVPGVGFALAWPEVAAEGSPARVLVVAAAPPEQAAALLATIERRLRPRWVWWSARPAAAAALRARVRLAACWDLAAVHRLLHGGRRGDAGAVWAAVAGLPAPPPPRSRPAAAASAGQLDLWDAADEPDASADQPAPGPGALADRSGPLRGDGQLDTDWPARAGTAAELLRRAGEVASLALRAHAHQRDALRRLPDPRPEPGRTALAVLTGRAESAAELLALELERDGLPLARHDAEQLLADLIGPPPRTPTDELAARQRRDAAVLAHLREPVDLRHPAAVRAGLRAVGIDVPDTRSGRLEPLRGTHPVVGALLTWRRAERIATTYGYRWLDTHVGTDGRLRGTWHASDGGAGRMTAQAGLHNLPADLRRAVAAEPGRVFVRAALGQIEPRVLAVVSGDGALAHATQADDMYAPVAAQLHLGRPDAKVAVLAAMYGQTSGAAGEALRRMRRAYPAALAFLDNADAAGRAGQDLRTFGGRLIRLAPASPPSARTVAPPPRGLTDPRPAGDAEPESDAARLARGRFARNAVVQGPAAELFKSWAATVRAALPTLDGEIVLCLHDELLLQVPEANAEQAVDLAHRTLAGTAAYWSSGSNVRILADVAILRRWSEAHD